MLWSDEKIKPPLASMFRKNSLIAIVVVLAIVIAWQVGMINGERSQNIAINLSELDRILSEITRAEDDLAPQPSRSFTQSNSSWDDETSRQIESLLNAEKWLQAVTTINDVYSQASSQQLIGFKSMVLRAANQLNHNNKRAASALLLAYTEAFNDVDACANLAPCLAS